MRTAFSALLCLALAAPLSAEPRIFSPQNLALIAAHTADGVTTRMAINSGRCHEANPWMGDGSTGRMIAQKAPLIAGAIALDYYAQKQGSKPAKVAAKILVWTLIGTGSAATINNAARCF